jgi:drug/metabolite transporter (DMT)-like permease
MLLLTVTIWALNFTVSKYILDAGSAAAVLLAALLAAALVFVGLTVSAREIVPNARGDLPLVGLR